MVITVTLNPTIDKVLEVADFRVGVHAQARLVGLLPCGKGNNVARGLARLGGRAEAHGFVGRYQAPFFARSLEDEGVRVHFCAVDGRTRTNTTVLDPKAHTSTHLREPGFEVTRADRKELLTMLSESLRALPEPPTVVIGGSLPPGMEPDDVLELMNACATRHALVVADLNGPVLRAALEAGLVDTLKPNLLELGECLGEMVTQEDAVEAARALLGRVNTVLLTLGENGAYLIRRGIAVGVRCRLEQHEVRNTVGCGDAFLAGWLRGAQTCGEPVDMLRWATAAGAASAMFEMTVGYGLKDVEGLLPRCEQMGD